MLHLLGSAGDESTAHMRIVRPLADGLRGRGYAVHAWFLGDDGPLVDASVEAGLCPRVIGWTAGPRDPIGAARLFRAFRTTPFAIVHQHFGGRSVRRVLRAATPAKIVVHLHGRVSEADFARLLSPRVSDADAVVATSAAVAHTVGVGSVHVVYPGVSVLGLPNARMRPTPLVIGTAARLGPVKGVGDLLRAFAIVSAQVENVRFEIAGSGPAGPQLEQAAWSLGIGNSVKFLGWRRDLPEVFSSWDIFAQASREEAFGLAALEAMASGLPVVATAVGGVPELVSDDETGFLVPPRDVDRLAARLRFLLLNPERRLAMGAASRARARKEFAVERMVADVAALYDELLQPPGHAAQSCPRA